MDPASAIGVAAGAIAFLDFAIELVKGSHEIYCSLNGSTEENAHIDLVIYDLQSASASLLLQQTPSRAGLVSQHEKALIELGTKCHRKCTELLRITNSLQVHDRSKWSSFKTAWKSRWKKDDIDRMHSDLRDYRLAILLRLNQMQIENQLQAHEKLDAMLLDFRRLIKDEHPTEASICSRIKHQLYFKSIYSREDGISDPGEGTFAWIMDQSSDYAVGQECEVPDEYVQNERQARSRARSEYLSWLGQDVQIRQPGTQNGDVVAPSPRILHISGKAGSGKSTLMRYLSRHDQTRAALKKWAGDRTLVLASFYFWVASDDDMQKSLEGLYRTILHDVLHDYPDLGAYLFPSQWQEIQRSIDRREEARDSADAVLFRGKAIQEAFSKLVGSTANNSPIYCFCFFIDGLDEYRERASNGVGDSKDLSPGFRNLAKQLLRWNKAAHVKICSTARPHTEFLDPLRRDKATVLHLEDVNQCDIYRYCKKAFEKEGDIAEMQRSYLDLVATITSRAKGVFLWAILTVRALTTSLVRGDSKSVQMQKLDAIPPELDSLYQMLLDRVDISDRDRSNQRMVDCGSITEIEGGDY
ncbi:hypothetical protein F503_07943 [Ophiostoma piceae UAMH 11346]|uniref:NACHT domain-containing protein n=1 Tax=Ophiostoma piceae (strain UAMH 11346) TaxID=1262450 RepID=S3C3E4_OPHP1|nr:hypothetical protein F503_07943 [Ophiostoma piceae UAMH 11346]